MRIKLALLLGGIVFLCVATVPMRADEVEMRNGDRYLGNVLSVSTDTVVLESEVLGKINLRRRDVANLALGGKAAAAMNATQVAQAPGSTNQPTAAPATVPGNTNVDLSAALRNLGANTNFIGQVRDKMLLGSPEAACKYDELVNGLMSGKLDMNDLRREARSSADQLRALKQDLGPEAGDTLDGYLNVLDHFLEETATEPASAAPGSLSKPQVH